MSLTEGKASSTPTSAQTQPNEKNSEFFPATTTGLIKLGAQTPATLNGKPYLSAALVPGSDLELGSQITNKEAATVSVDFLEIDAVGHRSCFSVDLQAFSTCPSKAPATVAINEQGQWSYAVAKNLFVVDADYVVSLVLRDHDSRDIGTGEYKFHWVGDSLVGSSNPAPANSHSAEPSSHPSPEESASITPPISSLPSAEPPVATTPTIIAVTTANANGSYKIGDLIDIAVTFSEPVVVVGIPTLEIQTSQGVSLATYAMGSGSRILTFAYTIASGVSATDLDYSSDHAFILNAGDSIKSLASVQNGQNGQNGLDGDASLTLPAPGGPQSLSGSSTIAVDGVAPAIVSVATLNAIAGGTMFKIGDFIDISVSFSEPIVVTGTPQLTMGTGATASYTQSVTPPDASTLIFRYNITSGQTASDLDYASAAALSLGGGGSIKDMAGNSAILTLATPGSSGSLGSNRNIVVDAVVPTVTQVSASPGSGIYSTGYHIDIRIQFSENVFVTGVPLLTLETGSTDHTATYSGGSGSTILSFDYLVQSGDVAVDLDYISSSALLLNGGTISDAATNNSILTLPAPAAAGSLGANASLSIDTTAPVVSQVTSANSDGTYTLAQPLSLQIVFSEAVYVTGVPHLTLETGATDYVANYTGGSGTNTLTFGYTVQTGDSSSDLDYTATTSLALNGGTILDGAANNAVLTLASPGATGSLGANRNFVISNSAIFVTNVSSSKVNGTYTTGEVISIDVTFSDAVTVVGLPNLVIETGLVDAVAVYSSGSTGTVLTFDYTVATGEFSTDLEYVNTSALTLNGGTIRDSSNIDAALALPTLGAAGSLSANKNLVVDAKAPTVTQVTASNTNGTYTPTQTVTVQVIFSEVVIVTGIPQLTLETGLVDQVVNYTSGSNSTTLSFVYTVQTGDSSADLDFKSTSALDLNTGTIKDATGNDAVLTLVTPGSAGSLGSSKNLVISNNPVGDFTITGPATTSSATPSLAWNTSSGATKYDVVVSSTSDCATVSYSSSDVVATSKTTTALASGTYYICVTAKDNGSNSKAATNTGFQMVVDLPPVVNSVTSNTADGTYGTGATIDVLVTFSKIVNVTGTPTLQLETGTTDQTLSYVSGSGSTTLRFDYVVQSANTSADLNYKATSSLALAGGTIKDAGNNNATLTLPALASANALAGAKAIVIDGTGPTPSSVSSNTTNGTYGPGTTIDVIVNYPETVIVTGTPTLQLETGTVDQTLNYVSGSGTSSLRFDYVIQTGNSSADLNYKATSSLALNGGTIKDSFGNTAILTLPAVGSASSLAGGKAIVVDGLGPTVSTVTSSTANGSYGVGQTIDITLNFSETATVTGVPTLQLETGTTDQVLNYVSGSGSTTIHFSYTVQAGDSSADLSYKATSSFALNGGTIVDAFGNNATLTLPTIGTGNSLSGSKAIVVDTTSPTVSSVSSNTANATYGVGSVIDLRVTFSELVNVTGTPTIQMNTGGNNQTVNYSSGTASTVLIFNYTVQAEDYSTDLNYYATNALSLAGGTIKDAAGNDAALTLPALASASSLAGSKQIVVNAVTAAPGAFTISGVNTGATESLVVAWNTPAGQVSSYTVKYGVTSGSYPNTASSAATNPYTITGLANGNTYYVMVTAVNVVGSTNATSEQSGVPASFWVSAGRDRTEKSSFSLGGQSQGSTTLAWTKISGAGTVTFGNPSSATSSVSADTDGTYVLRLTGTNAGALQTYDEMTLVWDTSSPVFTSLGLTSIASDGVLDRIESRAGTNLVTALSASNYQWAKYLLVQSSSSCNAYTDAYYRPEVPAGYDTYSYGADDYKVCVELGRRNGNTTFGETASFTRDITLPASAPRTVKSVSVGDNFGCVILDNDTVKCWGRYGLGYDDGMNRGDNQGEFAAIPAVNLGSGRTAKQIGTGGSHICAILDNDLVKCWGTSSYTGNGSGSYSTMASLPTVNLGSGRTAKHLSVSDTHNCAVLDDDTVKCWGQGLQGALGYDDTANRGQTDVSMTNLPAVFLGTGRTARFVATHNYASCAILDTGDLKCWGANYSQRLGYDDFTYRGNVANSMAALGTAALGAGRTAKTVSLGSYHTCAILDTDQLKCWGGDSDGQLGNNSTTGGPASTSGTVNLGAGRTALAVTCGENHTCAVLDDYSLKCWGKNGSGELGLNDLTVKLSPVAIGLGSGRSVKAVNSLTTTTCAILDNDGVKCWGANQYGAVGNDSMRSHGGTAAPLSSTPAVFLGAGRTAKKFSVSSATACALLDTDDVKCWGYNQNGLLGYGDTLTRGDNAGEMAALPVVDVGGGHKVKDISAYGNGVCVVLDNDTVKCWGYNTSGVLGLGDTAHRGDNAGEVAAMPAVNLGTGRTAKTVQLGAVACAILDTDELKCWGTDTNGMLGKGTATSFGKLSTDMANLTPIFLGTGRTVREFSNRGGSHICAILDDASLKCWGANTYGQLGYDDTQYRGDNDGEMEALGPVNLGPGRRAKKVSVTSSATCVVLDDDSVKCWGRDDYIQIARGGYSDYGSHAGDMAALAPIDLGTGLTANDVALGFTGACTLLNNNSVKCWGTTLFGGLGYDDRQVRGDGGTAGPVSTLGTLNFGAGRTPLRIELGQHNGCVLLDDQTLHCFGRNDYGNLGYDDTLIRGGGVPLNGTAELYFP